MYFENVQEISSVYDEIKNCTNIIPNKNLSSNLEKKITC
jgi:hypothetical protein